MTNAAHLPGTVPWDLPTGQADSNGCSTAVKSFPAVRSSHTVVTACGEASVEKGPAGSIERKIWSRLRSDDSPPTVTASTCATQPFSVVVNTSRSSHLASRGSFG